MRIGRALILLCILLLAAGCTEGKRIDTETLVMISTGDLISMIKFDGAYKFDMEAYYDNPIMATGRTGMNLSPDQKYMIVVIAI